MNQWQRADIHNRHQQVGGIAIPVETHGLNRNGYNSNSGFGEEQASVAHGRPGDRQIIQGSALMMASGAAVGDPHFGRVANQPLPMVSSSR